MFLNPDKIGNNLQFKRTIVLGTIIQGDSHGGKLDFQKKKKIQILHQI